MRIRRSILVTIAALAIWTAMSFVVIDLATAAHGCSLLSPVGADGTFHPMTQAEMSVRTAGCNRPKIGDIIIPASGYIPIVTVGIGYVTAGKRAASGNS
jgi:hypothetical protein